MTPSVGGPPDTSRLIECVRRGLCLDDKASVGLRDVGELSNINYVYAVEAGDRSCYLKVTAGRPKRLAVNLPRERALAEAEALQIFRRFAEGGAVIPEVLFFDVELMAIGMEDVGKGRTVLFHALPSGFELLAECAESLGTALGRIHAGTAGSGAIRPPSQEAIIRKVIFEGLYGPGARLLFPNHADRLLEDMQAPCECLVHADLWGKNLLVMRGAPPALVDFEGVFYGEPAFDLGTLAAVALVAAAQAPERVPGALHFSRDLLTAWQSGSNAAFSSSVPARVLRILPVFLAARACGPFSYEMPGDARSRLSEFARTLALAPADDWESFESSVVRILSAAVPSARASGAFTV